MNYEEKYNEILEWARKNKARLNGVPIEEVLPELSESEDERTRKWIVKFVTEQYPECWKDKKNKMLDYLEKQKEQIPYIDFVIKPHKGDDNNPYDMRVSEAQEYAINRGFGIPFNDGEVYVDERHITQTIGNILRWADEHPKEQKPAEIPPYVTGFKGEPDPAGVWKPSEEQMEALQNAVALTACDKELVRLYNQLKKL